MVRSRRDVVRCFTRTNWNNWFMDICILVYSLNMESNEILSICIYIYTSIKPLILGNMFRYVTHTKSTFIAVQRQGVGVYHTHQPGAGFQRSTLTHVVRKKGSNHWDLLSILETHGNVYSTWIYKYIHIYIYSIYIHLFNICIM